jgi:hypothetical protein
VIYSSTVRSFHGSLAILSLGATIAAAAAACTSFTGSDVVAGGSDAAAGGADAAQTDGGGTALEGGANGCPSSGHGPAMVRVDDVCIDSTEVTQGQFAALLMAKPPPDLGPLTGSCPVATLPSANDLVCPGSMSGTNLPQTCVTTCEAVLFCLWAGKHLCGPRPGSSPTQPPTPATSEWIYACTGGKNRLTHVPSGCNVKKSAMNAIRPVATGGCESPPGVFDLIGNATERTFIIGPGGEYYSAGDSYDFTSIDGGNSCLNVDTDNRDARAADIGFRCCASAQ